MALVILKFIRQPILMSLIGIIIHQIMQKQLQTVITWWDVHFKMKMGSSYETISTNNLGTIFHYIQCHVTYSEEGFQVCVHVFQTFCEKNKAPSPFGCKIGAT
jgi:hypothetical protein